VRLTALALLAGLALGGASPPPLTVDNVLADAAGYDEHWVRLHGLIDQCTANSCHVCPSADAPAQACIVVRDWHLPIPPEGSAGFDTRYRFAEVVLRGYFRAYTQAKRDVDDLAIEEMKANGWIFDPPFGRVRRYRGNIGGAVGDAWLADVEVEQVVTQRPATAGPVLDANDQWLRPLSVSKAILADFARQAPRGAGLKPGRDVRLFAQSPEVGPDSDIVVVRTDGQPIGDILWLCQATVRRLDRWPSRASHLLPSPGNPYRCVPGSADDKGRLRFFFG
jgi:hypothetical protein